MLWIKIEMTDNYIHLIFKVKQYKNAKIANFVYYGKTRFFRSAREVLLMNLNWQSSLLNTLMNQTVANVHLYNCLPFPSHRSILRLELPQYPWDQFMSYCKFWMSAAGHFPLIVTKWKLDETVWYAKLFLCEFLAGLLSNILVRCNCCSEAVRGMLI